jgi:predicted nuclease with TOPRIM domain
MKKWAFIFSIALLAVSCNSLLKSKPAGTLSEEKMTEVLVDIHITEAILRIGNDSLVKLNDTSDIRNRFAQVFRKHDVEPDEFNKSLNYYIQHIEMLDKIYVEVINRLTEMEANLQQKTSAPPVTMANRGKPGQLPASLNNQWYRMLNKTEEPVEIQYFDSTKYPVSSFK